MIARQVRGKPLSKVRWQITHPAQLPNLHSGTCRAPERLFYRPPPAPFPPELLWVWAALPRVCCSALLPAAAASLLGVSLVTTFPVELPVPPVAPLVPAD